LIRHQCRPHVWQRLTEELQRDVLLISAVTGQGLNHLTGAIAREMTGGKTRE